MEETDNIEAFAQKNLEKTLQSIEKSGVRSASLISGYSEKSGCRKNR